MKSNSDIRPAIIQHLGNGSYYYNYGVTEIEREGEPTATDTESDTETAVEDNTSRRSYDYNSVQLWGLPDYAEIAKAVIRDEIDETAEFGVINDYNAVQLGIVTDPDEVSAAEAAYKAHITRVAEIKAMVKADLAEAGY